MYRPTVFQEDDVNKLVAFMRANSFATLVSIVDGIPFASHIPLVVKVENNLVKLIGHLAKQNPHWQAFALAESLAIFTGAHSYISPTLYEQEENVPTWNYIAVHAYGFPQVIRFDETPQLMDKMINDMVQTYEADYQSRWEGLSSQYREGMMKGIIGFEMNVTRLEGKYKLSQNKSQIDRQNVSCALLQSADPIVRAVGEEMDLNLELGK
jgi:transcriptional regulator